MSLIRVLSNDVSRIKLKREYTTIALKRKTINKLKSLGKKGETYEEIIQRLLRLEKEQKKEKTKNE